MTQEDKKTTCVLCGREIKVGPRARELGLCLGCMLITTNQRMMYRSASGKA